MSPLRPLVLGVTAILLIGVTAVLLHRLRSSHRLGEPGVRLVDVSLVDEKGEKVADQSIHLPSTVAGFSSQLLPVTREELEWLPPDTTYGRRRYWAEDGFQVQVSGVLMGSDRTSIHKPEFCLPGQGFRILRRTQDHILIEHPHRYYLPVTRLDALREVQTPDGRVERIGAVYVYWFLSDTRLSNDHFERMWWLAADLIRTGELQRWAYMGCLSPCPPGMEDAAYARIQTPIQELVPEFQDTTGPQVSTFPTSPTESRWANAESMPSHH
jgi:hypothetical protein